MNDSTINRTSSFTLSLTILDRKEFRPLWLDQEPTIFTTKVKEVVAMLGEIHDHQKDQEAKTTGFTSEKAREEDELEEAAFGMSQALLSFADDHGQEGLGSDFALPRSAWTQLRDQQLLAKTLKLIEALNAVAAGPKGKVAATYGISGGSTRRGK